MSLVYNVNACKIIIDFCKKRLEPIQTDIEFLKCERDAATELAVRFAMDEALTRREYDKTCVEMKIGEMEQYLNGPSQS